MQAVWGDDEGTARQAVQRLASAGLLEETAADVWWMHDLLREYAGEQLARAGAEELDATRLAHARHWQDLLDTHELRSTEDWQWLERQRPEVELAAEWLLSDWQRAPRQAGELAVAISQAYQSYTWPQWERWMAAGMAAAEAGGELNAARRLRRTLGEHHRSRGDLARAEGLLRTSLATAKALLEKAANAEQREIGQRGVAVTQSSLADLLRTRGHYDEAERLYRSGLATSRAISDPQGVAVFLMGLGRLALERARPDEALPLLYEARQRFVDLGLLNWVDGVDHLLAQVEGNILTLDDLVSMVRAACHGDQRAGQQAWKICGALIGAPDPAMADIGRGLQRVLAAVPPETALAGLPDDLRSRIMAGLDSDD